MYGELRKHAHKIIYEESENLKVFDSSSVEEIYENIIQSLMNVRIAPVEEVKRLPETAATKSEGANLAKGKVAARKRQSSRKPRKPTKKRVKEDKGWNFSQALNKAKKNKQ